MSEFKKSPTPDIILITIDTLRADALGYAGNKKVSTPFLDKLASEGVVFTDAHAHNVVTLPSHVNILTGLLPYQHGVRDNSGYVLDPSHHTIAWMLKRHGYTTGAFIAAFPLDSRFGLNQGFDDYDDKYEEGRAPTSFVMPQRSAPEVLTPAVKWYRDNAGRKRFMWVHIYEPHAPYTPPSPFRERHPHEPYLGEVEAADFYLGKYLTPILDQNRDTMVIVTGDHGESLGEHGESTHGLFAYEATLHIPLIVWEKGVLAHRRETRAVRHIDIVPTILTRLGIPKPPQLLGASLLDIKGPRDTYFEALTANLNMGWAPLIGIIHADHKYIDLPLAELYNLPKDPHELHNILNEDRRDVVRARKLLAKKAPNALSSERKSVTSEESANLMSLGYVSGNAEKKKAYTAADDPKNLVQFQEMIDKIVGLYQEGKPAAAITMARKLIKERPEMSTAKDMLAFLLQETEHPEQAIDFLERQVAKGTASTVMRKRLGLVLSETGRSAEAVKVLAEFADSDDPDLLNAYGIALADTGRVQDAISEFQKALAVDHTNATAYTNLGIVALRADDTQRAEGYLNQALDLNPQMPLALNTLGVVYAREGQDERAIDAWSKAVNVDPKQYDALFNLSIVATKVGRLDVARKALEQFIQTAPPQRFAKDIASAKQMLASLPSGPS